MTLIVAVVVALLVGAAIGAGWRAVTARRLRPDPPTGRDLPVPVASPASAPVPVEADAAPAASSDHDRRTLEALWQLQRLEMHATRRRDADLSTAAGSDDGPVGLAEAIGQEIARIREEIGTPGEFSSDLATEPGPAAALLLLRSVQSTLDLVARRSQAFDLHLEGGEPGVAVTVLCDDFDGDPPDTGSAPLAPTDPPVADPDAAAIAAAVGPAGVTLVFGRSTDGRVCARLRVPAA